jgi:hypothetical protein
MAIATKQPGQDSSQLYIAVRERDGRVVTAREVAENDWRDHDMYCPCCMQRGDRVQVHLDPVDVTFVHDTDVPKACYRDDRCNDRHHQETTQAVYAALQNDFTTEAARVEWWTDHATFDVAADTPFQPELEGVVVEAHHKCANVRRRIKRKVRAAAKLGYGIHIVTTEEATAQTFLNEFIKDYTGPEATVGSYEDGKLELGAMIHPDDVLANRD